MSRFTRVGESHEVLWVLLRPLDSKDQLRRFHSKKANYWTLWRDEMIWHEKSMKKRLKRRQQQNYCLGCRASLHHIFRIIIPLSTMRFSSKLKASIKMFCGWPLCFHIFLSLWLFCRWCCLHCFWTKHLVYNKYVIHTTILERASTVQSVFIWHCHCLRSETSGNIQLVNSSTDRFRIGRYKLYKCNKAGLSIQIGWSWYPHAPFMEQFQ